MLTTSLVRSTTSQWYIYWGDGLEIHPDNTDTYTVDTYRLIAIASIDAADELEPTSYITVSTMPVISANDTLARKLPFRSLSNHRWSLYLAFDCEMDELNPPVKQRSFGKRKREPSPDQHRDGQQDDGNNNDEDEDDEDDEKDNEQQGKKKPGDQDSVDEEEKEELIYPLLDARRRRAPPKTERDRQLKESKDAIIAWIHAAYGRNDTVRAIRGTGTNKKGQHSFKTLCQWVEIVYTLMTPAYLRDLPDPASELPATLTFKKNKNVYWNTLFGRDTSFLTLCRKCAVLIEEKRAWQSFLDAEEDDKDYGVSSLYALLNRLERED